MLEDNVFAILILIVAFVIMIFFAYKICTPDSSHEKLLQRLLELKLKKMEQDIKHGETPSGQTPTPENG